MPNFNVSIEMTDEDKTHLKALTDLAVAQKTEKWKTYVLGERIRTIDQIKRLYAVVMGLAVLNCVNNAYVCARQLQYGAWEEYSILIAEIFSFISLITLFYLGAERMLDRRYLHPKSGMPKRTTLLFDLFTLGITAAWFVALANTFPRPAAVTSGEIATMRDLVHDYFGYFILLLIGLYILDIVLLGIHGFIVWKEGYRHRNELIIAYLTWVSVNVASVIVWLWMYRYHLYDWPMTVPVVNVPVNLGALFLFAWHAVRFVLDFNLTFGLYYPSQDPNKPEEDL
jgi:hypothetical protein